MDADPAAAPKRSRHSRSHPARARDDDYYDHDDDDTRYHHHRTSGRRPHRPR
ncbi:hypothetical protein LOZ44_006846, partial [Ophidiomyces ophidiicola]